MQQVAGKDEQEVSGSLRAPSDDPAVQL